ncbi:hypothetical protein AAMO2058_000085600 [Amorphochlora amoebiformis]|mmetsp:Transcript_22889/g.35928  ORF Transcript_22889/g.35928 Transcript_22889/m.35928 type:complete len:122 (+) Transcript_22889:2776-3141(+)
MGLRASCDSFDEWNAPLDDSLPPEWQFRRLPHLQASTDMGRRLKVAIHDWVRWRTYLRHTTPAQREDEKEFTEAADKVDDIIVDSCWPPYDKLTNHVGIYGPGKCSNLMHVFEKCVTQNHK